jgi:single-strand DNA-binding protein
MADNTITISGNLARDPEIAYRDAGATCRFTVAVNRRWQSNGEWQEQTSFIDCTAFGTLAENLAASTTKGARVIVSGRLQQSTYTDKTGAQRSSVQLVASDIGASLMFARADIERIERTESAQRTMRNPQPQQQPEEPF